MKAKYSILTIFICSTIVSCSNGQTNEISCAAGQRIELTQDVLKLLAQYISSVNSGRTGENNYKVFRLLIEQKDHEVSFRIYPIIYYSHLVNDPPSAYLDLKVGLILINTGIEKISMHDQRFLEELKKLVGIRLENDLAADGKTVKPGFRHRTYNPEVWKVVLGDSIMINKEAEQPVRIKFIDK